MNKLWFAGVAGVMCLAISEAKAASKYEYCMRDASKVGDNAIAECMAEEAKRVDALIYKQYEKIAADPDFQSWNNGTGMFRGKAKDLYETWYKFRSEYCSLFTLSMKNYVGTDAYNTQRCLLDFAQQHYNYIKAITDNKDSTPD